MLSAILERQAGGPTEELLKLYWNRADVKREVKALRRERFELLDKLKEQEGAIQRAQEQLEGLERLLTNPLAAANAMVYFQLRHLWRVGGATPRAVRPRAANAAREARARATPGRRDGQAAAAARCGQGKDRGAWRRSAAHAAEEQARLEQKLASMNSILRLFRAGALKRQIAGLAERPADARGEARGAACARRKDSGRAAAGAGRAVARQPAAHQHGHRRARAASRVCTSRSTISRRWRRRRPSEPWPT